MDKQKLSKLCELFQWSHCEHAVHEEVHPCCQGDYSSSDPASVWSHCRGIRQVEKSGLLAARQPCQSTEIFLFIYPFIYIYIILYYIILYYIILYYIILYYIILYYIVLYYILYYIIFYFTLDCQQHYLRPLLFLISLLEKYVGFRESDFL